MRPTLIINGQFVRYVSFALDDSLLTVTRRPIAERTSQERWRVRAVRLYQDPLPLAGFRRSRPRLHVDAEPVVDVVAPQWVPVQVRRGVALRPPYDVADFGFDEALKAASRRPPEDE